MFSSVGGNTEFNTAYMFSEQKTDFLLDFKFGLFKKGRYKLSAKILYHIDYLKNICVGNDFFAGIFYDFHIFPWHKISLNLNYFLKLQTIFSVADKIPVLPVNSLSYCIFSVFYLPKDLSIYMGISSYENFRYMILGEAIFVLGANISADSAISFDFNTKIRYIDFFTLSSNFENCGFEFSFKVKL